MIHFSLLYLPCLSSFSLELTSSAELLLWDDDVDVFRFFDPFVDQILGFGRFRREPSCDVRDEVELALKTDDSDSPPPGK